MCLITGADGAEATLQRFRCEESTFSEEKRDDVLATGPLKVVGI